MVRPSLEVKGLTRAELEHALQEMGELRYRAAQIFQWIYKRQVGSFEDMSNLPKALRHSLAERFTLKLLSVLQEDRSRDGARKFLFGLEDGKQIESVLIPDEDRMTACLSTQAGCALACAFCLTGVMGFQRHLEAWEIIGQIPALQERLQSEGRITHLVLMGMGEPLHNYEATVKALRVMTEKEGLAFSPRRITLSTVGLPKALEKLGEEGIGVNLAISLHAPTDDLRDQLVPINRRYPLKELLEACRAYPLPPRRRLTFEYVLLDGVNDRIEDAKELAVLLQGLRCKINLIPLNEAPEIPFKRPSRERLLAFQQVLHDQGYTATLRESRGWDISAACGMLNTEAVRKGLFRNKRAFFS
ncbi:MAG: 23S rRNA (adenine(2503)-C(2))-methyltransferase RlmN [candidate division NC10 bacterium]|nr:23S rRNA (adenine(2503)-C(2))-methyltransferase RlmN [candidate division NC10 bacterium]